MSTENCAPEIPSEPAPEMIMLTRQEFDSLCQRAKYVHRIMSRFCATLQAIQQRSKRNPLYHKPFARKLRRLAANQ